MRRINESMLYCPSRTWQSPWTNPEGVESYEPKNAFDRRRSPCCKRVSTGVCPAPEGQRSRQPTRCVSTTAQLGMREIPNGRARAAVRVRLFGNESQELRSGEPILDQVLRPRPSHGKRSAEIRPAGLPSDATGASRLGYGRPIEGRFQHRVSGAGSVSERAGDGSNWVEVIMRALPRKTLDVHEGRRKKL